MKRKHLSLAIAALLAAGGLWFAWSAWHAHRQQVTLDLPKATQAAKSGMGAEHHQRVILDTPNATQAARPSMGADFETPPDRPNPGQALSRPARLAPPVPNKRFTDFTPEQRVKFARQGHGPGG